MTRFIKILLNLLLASIVAGLTLIIVFFMAPAWQKHLLEKAMARDTGRQWQVGKVSIQPFSIDLGDVYVIDGSVGAGARHIHASGPFWKMVLFGELEVENGSVLGLDMDLSKIQVGDQTSEDYQAFLGRLTTDTQLWEERIGLLISKASAEGFSVDIKDTTINGTLLMPGERIVPVNWRVVEADSDNLENIRVEPIEPAGQEL